MGSYVSKQEVKPESDIPFVRILVQPEEGPLQVSFDNHANRNYWSYHPDTGRPHGTESFKLEPVGEEKVIIIGTQSPRGPRWVLIVREDEAGVPDRYPRFHPEEDVLVGDRHQHAEFTLLENPDGSIAFSFQTVHDSQTVFFVPTSNRLRRIETKMTEEAEYPFRRQIITEDELKELSWEDTCEDTSSIES